jgi:hypothetical protein
MFTPSVPLFSSTCGLTSIYIKVAAIFSKMVDLPIQKSTF